MAQHWSIIFATNDEKPKFLFELRRAIFEATTQQPFVNVQVGVAAVAEGVAGYVTGLRQVDRLEEPEAPSPVAQQKHPQCKNPSLYQ